MKYLHLILTGIGGFVMGSGIIHEEVLIVAAGAMIAIAGFLKIIIFD